MSIAVTSPRVWRDWSPLAVAVLATAILWAVSPTLGDLQAAIAREEAARSGVGLEYWFGWFGGVSPGSYSLIVPAMSTVIGSLPLLCLATVVIAAMAYPLSRSATHPMATTWAIAIAAVLNLMSGRVAFAVGVAFALGSLLLIKRNLTILGVAGLVVSGLASPLAPAFVGLGSIVFLLYRPTRNRPVVAMVVGAALGVLVPFALFGAPGAQGFPWTTLFWIVLIGVTAGLAMTDKPSVWIAPLATVAAIVIFSFPNGVGSNISRFFCLVLPCLVLYFSRRPLRLIGIALIPAIVYAVFVAAADQFAVADASKPTELYAPLTEQLTKTGQLDNHRVELIDAGTHAGSHMLGNGVKLARGWENQSDSRYNPIFYDEGALTIGSYRDWLSENAVAYVAVSAKPLRQMKDEAALVATHPDYLQETWRNADWTLYRVVDPSPIVPAPLTLVSDSPSQMVIDVPSADRSYPVQIRPNRYLVARSVDDSSVTACIAETPRGWITLRVPSAGRYSLEGSFTVRGVLAEQSPVCSS